MPKLLNKVNLPQYPSAPPGTAVQGDMYYNTTADTVYVYDGAQWLDLAAGGGGSGDITEVVAGSGLTGGATSGPATLNVGAGTGITVNADDVAIDTTVVARKTDKLSAFASTTSAELAGVISDETGSGKLVFDTSPSLTTPSLGVATATSINGTTIPSSATLVTTGDTGSVTSTMIANGTIVNEDINSSAAIDDTKLNTISTAGKVSNSATTATSSNTSSTIVARNSSGDFSAGTISATMVSISGTTSNATDVATKSYVDSAIEGLDVKESVLVATTSSDGDISLSGLSTTIDGYTLSGGERVLVKNQTTQSQNGIYIAASGSWSRASDAAQNGELDGGTFVWVELGTTNADTGWVVTSDGTITIGSSAITWVQFSGTGQITAGTGLTKTGNTLSVTSNTYQPIDSELTALASLTSAADALPYFTGSGTAATTTLTSAARSILDDATVADIRATIGAQPLDAELTALAGLTSSADALPYFTGSGTASTTTLTSAARSILDDTSVGAIRTTLGVGTGDSPQFTEINVGDAADTTITRVSGGTIAVEGKTIATSDNTLTLTNKTFTDSTTTFQDDGDNTKTMRFQLSGISTATTRTLTVPNNNGTIALTSDIPAAGAVVYYSTTDPGGNNGDIWIDSDDNTPVAGSISNGNILINGAFDVWQRGTSFAAAGYTADRWATTIASGQTIASSQQSFTAGTAPVSGYEGTYFLRNAWSGTPTGAFWLTQRVEDVRTFAGQTVTLSYWAKASSATSALSMVIEQNFGTGGSSVVTTTGSTVSLTTSWQRFSQTFTIPSISGKTIGTSSYLDVRPFYGTTTVNGLTIDIWGVQLEGGSITTAFSRASKTLAGEIQSCYRYYYRHFPAVTSAFFGVGYCNGANSAHVMMQYPVPMRIAPSLDTTGTATDYSFLHWTGSTETADNLSSVPSIVTGESSLYASRIQLTRSTNWTGTTAAYGLPGMLRAVNTSAYLGFSAEL